MKELIGMKVNRVLINEDQRILAFYTDGGFIIYEAYGECCSETWFADITGVSALIGGTVQTVDEVNMENYNVEDGRTRQDCDEAYGYKLATDKGFADIVFRNSSNGYYGGSIELIEVNLPEGMVEITEDWSA